MAVLSFSSMPPVTSCSAVDICGSWQLPSAATRISGMSCAPGCDGGFVKTPGTSVRNTLEGGKERKKERAVGEEKKRINKERMA